MQTKMEQKSKIEMELVHLFEIEELEERMEFKGWTTSAETTVNSDGSSSSTFKVSKSF